MKAPHRRMNDLPAAGLPTVVDIYVATFMEWQRAHLCGAETGLVAMQLDRLWNRASPEQQAELLEIFELPSEQGET